MFFFSLLLAAARVAACNAPVRAAASITITVIVRAPPAQIAFFHLIVRATIIDAATCVAPTATTAAVINALGLPTSSAGTGLRLLVTWATVGVTALIGPIGAAGTIDDTILLSTAIACTCETP